MNSTANGIRMTDSVYKPAFSIPTNKVPFHLSGSKNLADKESNYKNYGSGHDMVYHGEGQLYKETK